MSLEIALGFDQEFWERSALTAGLTSLRSNRRWLLKYRGGLGPRENKAIGNQFQILNPKKENRHRRNEV